MGVGRVSISEDVKPVVVSEAKHITEEPAEAAEDGMCVYLIDFKSLSEH